MITTMVNKFALYIDKYYIDIPFLFGLDIKEQYWYFLDTKEEIELIDFESSILYPIYMISSLSNEFLIKTIPRNQKIILDDKIKNIISIAKKNEENYNIYMQSFDEKKQAIIQSTNNKWDIFYGKYFDLTKKYNNIYSFKINDQEYIIAKKNGLCKNIKTEKIYFFIDIIKKLIQTDNEEIWKKLEEINNVPIYTIPEIVVQNGAYYYKNKKEIVPLTNWTGMITGMEETDEGITWELNIEGNRIEILPYMLCDPYAFQRHIARNGMLFFYGNSQQLKKMFQYLHGRYIRNN